MINKVTLIGYIGRVETVSDKVTSSSVCTTRSWKDKESGEWVNKNTWHNLSVFGVLGNYYSKNISKGDLVLIEGEINYNEVEKDGVKTKYTNIVVKSYKKLKKKDATGEQTDAPEVAEETVPYASETASTKSDDDLPF